MTIQHPYRVVVSPNCLNIMSGYHYQGSLSIAPDCSKMWNVQKMFYNAIEIQAGGNKHWVQREEYLVFLKQRGLSNADNNAVVENNLDELVLNGRLKFLHE